MQVKQLKSATMSVASRCWPTAICYQYSIPSLLLLNQLRMSYLPYLVFCGCHKLQCCLLPASVLMTALVSCTPCSDSIDSFSRSPSAFRTRICPAAQQAPSPVSGTTQTCKVPRYLRIKPMNQVCFVSCHRLYLARPVLEGVTCVLKAVFLPILQL